MIRLMRRDRVAQIAMPRRSVFHVLGVLTAAHVVAAYACMAAMAFITSNQPLSEMLSPTTLAAPFTLPQILLMLSFVEAFGGAWLPRTVLLLMWLTYLVPLGFTAWWLTRAARRRRYLRKRGLCESCEYDLRASSDRCPECGTVVPAKATA
jgi:hypothetical protein